MSQQQGRQRKSTEAARRAALFLAATFVCDLLAQVPEEAAPQVVDFLKTLTDQPTPALQPADNAPESSSLAQQTFGLIPAPLRLVQQILAEDIYEAG